MSRIGKTAIDMPSGVTVDLKDNLVTVKGPKGEEKQEVADFISLENTEDNKLLVKVPEGRENERDISRLHGLYRSLINNMVVGVSEGFSKTLLIEGTGYRAQKQGNTLVLNLGYSHQIKLVDPEGITVEVPNDRTIIVKGSNKQLVGEHAANIRKNRKPEPYKGKGIKYSDEHILRKVGKTGK